MPNVGLLPTTVVGSYPQPDWLVDKAILAKGVPRVRVPELWRVEEHDLEHAQDAATLMAIRDMEDAGIDIISDGEIRRESYSNHFVSALAGIDEGTPGTVAGSRQLHTPVPRVVGDIRRTRPIEVRDAEFLRANTDRPIKVTLPGPFTMAQQAVDDHYRDEEQLATAFAEAVNDEALALAAVGVDVIQLDEPWVRRDPDAARRFAARVIDRALRDINATTAVHICFGYGAVVGPDKPSAYSFLPELADTAVDQISIEAAQPRLDLSVLRELGDKDIILGVLDLGTEDVETPDLVAERVEAALRYVAPERLIPAPDCGMKYLQRSAASGKLRALAAGVRLARERL
jgi:5-methyltetrahydropteroyltriglutamate--homocysteine methyltransferase